MGAIPGGGEGVKRRLRATEERATPLTRRGKHPEVQGSENSQSQLEDGDRLARNPGSRRRDILGNEANTREQTVQIGSQKTRHEVVKEEGNQQEVYSTSGQTGKQKPRKTKSKKKRRWTGTRRSSQWLHTHATTPSDPNRPMTQPQRDPKAGADQGCRGGQALRTPTPGPANPDNPLTIPPRNPKPATGHG